MYFQRLTFDLDTEGRVTDARIADPDIFSDAHVNWSKLAKSDRPWITSRLALIVSAFTSNDTPRGTWTLTGTSLSDTHADYTLSSSETHALPLPSEAARTTVDDAIRDILECVHGLIEIY